MTRYEAVIDWLRGGSIMGMYFICYGVVLVVCGELFKAIWDMAVLFPFQYLAAVPAALVAVGYIAYRAVTA